MELKQLAGRLLENDEGQGEDEADVQTGTQHTGVLNGGGGIKHASQQRYGRPGGLVCRV